MTPRGEGVEDKVERIATGLVDLASPGLDPNDGRLEDDPNPTRLRTTRTIT